MNIEALLLTRAETLLTARWLFHMIVINSDLLLWLHSFLGALDASLGSKIIQTMHFLVAVSSTNNCFSVVRRREKQKSHVRLRHFASGFL